MANIEVRRGYYERFGVAQQPYVSLSQGRGVLVVDPGTLAVLSAEDVSEGSVYVQDLTLHLATSVNAGEVPAHLLGEDLSPADLERVERLAAAHLRVYRYAVSCQQYGLGGAVGPEPSYPLVRSLEAARAHLAEYGRETGTDHGWYTDDEWVSASHGWVYLSSAWDGISYGDPVGVLEFGRRGGVRFEYA